MSRKLILAGVHEQVNIPIMLSCERNFFHQHGVEVEYRVVPEGTGKMLDLVDAGEVDVALCVTDAFIAGKAKGRKGRLCGVYVTSTLSWAICTHINSSLSSYDQLSSLYESSPSSSASPSSPSSSSSLRVGISRYGSGSHTMAYYLVKRLNIDVNRLEFVVLNNFDGLRQGIEDDVVDIFLWEDFTTKPYFDCRSLKRLGAIDAPWPAFSFIARPDDDIISLIRSCMFPAIQDGICYFLTGCDPSQPSSLLLDDQRAVDKITSLFGHRANDARQWLARTKYNSGDMKVDMEQMEGAVMALKELGLVPPSFNTHDLLI